jgi:hypothetical protein
MRRRRDNNLFLMLVGAAVSGMEPAATVTRPFTVEFLDEDNALYRRNANGFEG